MNNRDIVADWKRWHRELSDALGCEFLTRQVTLEKAKELRDRLAQAERDLTELRNTLWYEKAMRDEAWDDRKRLIQNVPDYRSPEQVHYETAQENGRLRIRLSETEEQVLRMAKLLLECRDALPAISTTAARLHNLDLTLADRIEEELKPWAVSDAASAPEPDEGNDNGQ